MKINKKAMQAFDQEKTFGVEVEFFNVHSSTVVQALQNAGFPCGFYSWGQKDRAPKTHWVITTDGSVTGKNTGEYCGLELVTPILKGDAGLAKLTQALQILTSLGADVDRTCGIHVHHHADDFTLDTWKNLFNLYVTFEPTLDRLVPPSRRNNNANYAATLRHYDVLEQIEQVTSVRDLQRMYGRQTKLNIHAFSEHGTIEFRHHGGSTDATKIITWVKLTQAMCTAARDGRFKRSTELVADSNDAWRYFKRHTGLIASYGADEDLQQVAKSANRRRKELFKADERNAA